MAISLPSPSWSVLDRPDPDAQPVGDFGEVGDFECHQLGVAEGAAKPSAASVRDWTAAALQALANAWK
jgi:hypothetical protein